MNRFLSHLHKHLRLARLTRQGATRRPEDVPEGMHKSYDRMPQIHLPEPALSGVTLEAAMLGRHSASDGDPITPLSLQDIGTLLGLALGKHSGTLNRNYPSGGRLYPIETYLISSGIANESAAAYHYNPSKHVLERLWSLPDEFDIKTLAKNPEWLKFTILLVFTSVWERSSAKYGDLSYLHAILEAGHMGQNVALLANAQGLESRPYAGFNDILVTQILDLDEESEQAVHTMTISKKSHVESDKHRHA